MRSVGGCLRDRQCAALRANTRRVQHALPICTAPQVNFAIACRVLIPSLIFIHARKYQFAPVICTTLALLQTFLHMLTAPCPACFRLFPAIIRQIIRPGALVLALH
jgi:hypothetical protein